MADLEALRQLVSLENQVLKAGINSNGDRKQKLVMPDHSEKTQASKMSISDLTDREKLTFMLVFLDHPHHFHC